MKITIDKKNTEGYQREQVKADIAEFKACFTDGDILREFIDQLDLDIFVYDIIYINGEAFPSGWACGNDTNFMIEVMFKANVNEIYEAYFFCDMSLNIRKVSCFGDKMYSIKKYTRQ